MTTSAPNDAYAAVTITLDPAQARYVTRTLYAGLSYSLEGKWDDVDSREEFTDIEAALAMYRDLLEQVAWGEAEHDVTFTVQRGKLEWIALQLVEVTRLDQVSEAASEAERTLAGVSLLKQLEEAA